MSAIDQAKLAKLQSSKPPSRIGGKGTARRKIKRHSNDEAADNKAVSAIQSKLSTKPLEHVTEVNMFKGTEGKVVHFTKPVVQSNIAVRGKNQKNKAFVVSGKSEDKELFELLPGILSQLGPESLQMLQQIAENLRVTQKASEEGKEGAEADEEAEDDEDIPDLVPGQTFEQPAQPDVE